MRLPRLTNYVDTVDDPQRVWLDEQKAKQANEAPDESDRPADARWIHPCGCETAYEAGGLAFPICAQHSLRASFIGRPGDGYVTLGR